VVIAPYVLALCVSLALSVGFGILTWRRRPEPGTTALTVLLAAVSVWTGAFLFGMLSPDRGIRMLLERIMWTAMLVTPVAWLVFSIQYTGYDDSIAPRQIASLSVPLAIAGVLVWTNPAHEIIWSDVQFHSLDGLVLVSQSYNAMFWVQLGYAYTLMLAGVVLLLRLVLTSDHLFADQAFALLAGGLIATSAHFATVFKLSPFPGLNLTPYSFVLAGIAFGYALFYSELLERIPATRRIGRNAIVQNMRDGVVVLDRLCLGRRRLSRQEHRPVPLGARDGPRRDVGQHQQRDERRDYQSELYEARERVEPERGEQEERAHEEGHDEQRHRVDDEVEERLAVEGALCHWSGFGQPDQ